MVTFVKLFLSPFLDLILTINVYPVQSLCILLVFVMFSISLLIAKKSIIYNAGDKVFRYFGWIVFTPTVILLMFYSLYFYAFRIEPNWIKVEKVTIKDKGLANALSGLKIVQLSDLHIWEVGYREKSLIKIINNIQPDILFITGDFTTDRDGIPACLQTIKAFKTRYGIFGCLGNGDVDYTKFKSAGITILFNQAKRMCLKEKFPFQIIGIDYSSDTNDIYRRVKRTLKHSNIPTILLNHSPCLLDAFEAEPFLKENINLILSGDTHGGQIGPQFLRTFYRKIRHCDTDIPQAGLIKGEKVYLYVNRGIGWNHMPVRLFCRPEVTVFKFITENKK